MGLSNPAPTATAAVPVAKERLRKILRFMSIAYPLFSEYV
jgi:hypothetical protein